LRCFKHNVVSGITGETFLVPEDDLHLRHTVDEGHLWWLLHEHTSKEDAMVISSWRNADNNQNQGNSVIQLMRSITNVAQTLTAKSGQTSLGAIAAKVIGDSIVKLVPCTVSALSKWSLNMGCGEYVEEWLKYAALHMDPTELTIAPNWFEDEGKSISKEHVLARLSIAMVHIDRCVVQAQIRPVPDICRFVKTTELNAFGGKRELLQDVEKVLRETRQKVEPLIAAKTSVNSAKMKMWSFMTNVARLALARPLHGEFKTTVKGRATLEKLEKLRLHWLDWVQKSDVGLENLAKDAGYDLDEEATPVADEVAE